MTFSQHRRPMPQCCVNTILRGGGGQAILPVTALVSFHLRGNKTSRSYSSIATFRRLSSHKPIGTSLKVINSLTSVMKCAAHCDRQMAPRCRSAQYNPSTKTCSLYQWFDNALNTNANSVMLVREYGVRFLT